MTFLTGKLGLYISGALATACAVLLVWGLLNSAAADRATGRAVTAERNFAEANRRAQANADQVAAMAREHAREMREVTNMAVRERARVANLEGALDEIRNDPTHGAGVAAVLERALDRLRVPASGPGNPDGPGPGAGPAVPVARPAQAAPQGLEPGAGR